MKRSTAFRNVRTICERLDKVDPNTFPVRPHKLYLYGSVLTDKPNPADVDVVLLCLANPVDDRAFLYALNYRPTLLPDNQARKHLRSGMRNTHLEIEMSSDLSNWEYLWLFPDGEGIWLIWKPSLNWSAIVDEIESHPYPWTGLRPVDSKQRMEVALQGLSKEERQTRIAEILTALEAQEAREE
jgi:hypothetical protein